MQGLVDLKNIAAVDVVVKRQNDLHKCGNMQIANRVNKVCQYE